MYFLNNSTCELSSGTSRPGDDHVPNLRSDLQRIARDDDEVGDLAGLDAADLAVDAEDARRVERQRLDRGVVRQAPGTARPAWNGTLRENWKPPLENANVHAGLRQHARRLIRVGVELVFARRQRQHARQDHRHVVLLEQPGDALRVGAGLKHDAHVLLLGPRHRVADATARCWR